ncbi:MAG: winged helix-turn-helix transcriptional regulator [Chloroflexi bacterium]|nr:winged helix-turn-helix transcriptional regulator [Chloroflexota bacterium]
MGRTTTSGARRTRSGASSADATRPAVRDFSGGASVYDVTFDARTAYDFIISLYVGTGDDQDVSPEDLRWLRKARGSLPPGQLDDLDACFGEESNGIFHGLPSLIVADPTVRDAAAVVQLLDRVPDADLIRHLLPELDRDEAAQRLLDRSVAGEADALTELEPRLPEHNRAQFVAFLANAGSRVTLLREVLRAWLPLFLEVEDRVARIIARDLEARAGDMASLDPSALIERTTGGLRWLPESNVRRVIMAPSYFGKPYNYIFSAADWRMFCYPVADAAVGVNDGTTPPQAVVRLYRALGDATRMRTLKLLADRDWYLTELATHLELSKPTMKHHLALLRAAGLVTVTEEGTLTYYSLRRERLTEAGIELTRYLG